MRISVYIAGFIAAAAMFVASSIPLAQIELADDELSMTTTEVAEPAQLVLDFEPQLPDNANTRESLTGILSQPEYLGITIEEPRRETMWDRFFRWLGHQLAGLGGGGSNTFAVVAVVLLMGLILFLLIRLIWDMFGGRRYAKDTISSAGFEFHSPVDLVAQATKASQKGEYQLAIRLRFKAVLGVLKMPSSTVLTNSQVLRRLKRNMPFAAAPFGEIATIFEDTWYGQQPSTAGRYKQVSECAEQIEHELEGLEE